MTIRIDEEKLVEKVNELVDIPYATESSEARIFAMGADAGARALVQLAGNSAWLADYGVSVTLD